MSRVWRRSRSWRSRLSRATSRVRASPSRRVHQCPASSTRLPERPGSQAPRASLPRHMNDTTGAWFIAPVFSMQSAVPPSFPPRIEQKSSRGMTDQGTQVLYSQAQDGPAVAGRVPAGENIGWLGEVREMSGGYWNRVLVVDLEQGTSHDEVLDAGARDLLLGGSGLGAWLWEHHSVPGAGALEPGNALVFAAGPLTGTFAPTSGRHEVVTRSPCLLYTS